MEAQRQFVSDMREAGISIGLLPWQADWFAAVACVESGWGRYIPQGSNNPIGYHWIPGTGWEWVTAQEGMTGKAQRYRVFRDYADAARSWRYLVERSSIKAYVAARRAYYDLTPDARNEDARQAWILGFSLGYCPADKRHGPKVLSIYGRIKQEM
jgi:hypothetical protein